MILIKGGRVVDPARRIDGVLDLVVGGGKIQKIGKYPRDGGYEKIVEAAGWIVSPGLIDTHVHFRDPGFLYKEDILTGAAAAAKGGFTTVVCMANTNPPVDSVETLRYVLEKGKRAPIRVLSVAAVTKGMEGRELTGMEELAAGGAVGFSDDGRPILDEALALRAMREAERLGLPLCLHEEDPRLIGSNGVNAGKIAGMLGLTGSPAVAEDVLVARDCMLALSTGARVCIQHVSSKNSVRLVRLAKEMGARLSAEATPHHFSLDEEAVLEYGTNAKVNPPLRTRGDRDGIIAGLRDGTIDIIATDHAPHAPEEKAKPFAEAPSGMIGLETSLALGVTNLVRKGHISVMQLLEKMSLNPARLYGLGQGRIEEGADADLTLFDAEERWTVGAFASRSCNSPFAGSALYGKVKMTICGGRIVYRDRPEDRRSI